MTLRIKKKKKLKAIIVLPDTIFEGFTMTKRFDIHFLYFGTRYDTKSNKTTNIKNSFISKTYFVCAVILRVIYITRKNIYDYNKLNMYETIDDKSCNHSSVIHIE